MSFAGWGETTRLKEGLWLQGTWLFMLDAILLQQWPRGKNEDSVTITIADWVESETDIGHWPFPMTTVSPGLRVSFVGPAQDCQDPVLTSFLLPLPGYLLPIVQPFLLGTPPLPVHPHSQIIHPLVTCLQMRTPNLYNCKLAENWGGNTTP